MNPSTLASRGAAASVASSTRRSSIAVALACVTLGVGGGSTTATTPTTATLAADAAAPTTAVVAAENGSAAAAGLASRKLASTPFSLASVTLSDGRRTLVRWNPCQAAITYRVNPTHAGPTATARAAAVADTREAFRRAGLATGMTFRFLGTTAEIPSGANWSKSNSDAEVVVAWVNQRRASSASTLLMRSSVSNGFAAGTGGYVYRTWTDGQTGWKAASGRGFVVLDSAQNAVFRPGFGRGVTRGALLLHEIGHVLGLQHVADKTSLMYPLILNRASANYAAGDRRGLQQVGRSAGCISIPTWVWPNE